MRAFPRRSILRSLAISFGGLVLAACGGNRSVPEETANANDESPDPAVSSGDATFSEPVASPGPSSELAAVEGPARPTANSVALNLIPAMNAAVQYEYGTASGAYSARTALLTASLGTPLETVVGGLQPNTRYFYRA